MKMLIIKRLIVHFDEIFKFFSTTFVHNYYVKIL